MILFAKALTENKSIRVCTIMKHQYIKWHTAALTRKRAMIVVQWRVARMSHSGRQVGSRTSFSCGTLASWARVLLPLPHPLLSQRQVSSPITIVVQRPRVLQARLCVDLVGCR